MTRAALSAFSSTTANSRLQAIVVKIQFAGLNYPENLYNLLNKTCDAAFLLFFRAEKVNECRDEKRVNIIFHMVTAIE